MFVLIVKKVFSISKWFSERFDKRTAVRALACGTVFAVTLCLCGFNSDYDSIRDNVLRLHILANSDSAEDQELKLLVRDELLCVSEKIFSDCDSEEEAAVEARINIGLLTETAEKVIADNGYEYPVTVAVETVWFGDREYDGFTLPAGNYEALRVIIGQGGGHNWWCVMFPAVCLPAASAEKSDISDTLDKNQTDMVKQPNRYKARFKVVEIYEKLRSGISSVFD